MVNWVVQYMEDNRYQVERDGLCFGISSTAKQYILLGRFDEFIRILKLIEEQHRLNQTLEQLREEEKLLDIWPFLDGIQLYQYPEKHLELFESKGCKTQEVRSKEIFDMVRPSKGEDNLNWVTYGFSGCYTEKQLQTYLQVLEDAISEYFKNCNETELSCNIGFQLTTHDHTVILNYDAKNKFLDIIDANDIAKGMGVLEEKSKSKIFLDKAARLECIAKQLYDSFNFDLEEAAASDSGVKTKLHTAIFTEIFVSYQSIASLNNMKNKFIDKLKNNHFWNELHTITDDKILTEDVGYSWLYIASMMGDIVIVPDLIKFNAKTDQFINNNYVNFPLWEAAANGHNAIVKLLIKDSNNEQVDQTNSEGNSTLWIAAQSGYTEIVEILIDKQADVNKVNNENISPLWVAARYGHTKIVEKLIDNQADINKSNNEGIFPLWVAAHEDHIAIVKLLLENNADFNMANNEGQTSLMIATENGHTEIVNLLEKHIKNQKGNKEAILFRPIVSNRQDIATPDIQVDDAKNQRIHLSKTF